MSRVHRYAVQINTPDASTTSTPTKIASFSQIDGRNARCIRCQCRRLESGCDADMASDEVSTGSGGWVRGSRRAIALEKALFGLRGANQDQVRVGGEWCAGIRVDLHDALGREGNHMAADEATEVQGGQRFAHQGAGYGHFEDVQSFGDHQDGAAP